MKTTSAKNNASRLLPPINFNELQWSVLGPQFTKRDSRHTIKLMNDINIESLRQQVSILRDILRNDLQKCISDDQLSRIFGRNGTWSRQMIQEYHHELESPHPLHSGRPSSIPFDVDEELIQYCLHGQHNRTPVTIQGAIDFVQSLGHSIDRYWVYRFLERHKTELTQMKPMALEPERHFVDSGEVTEYFRVLKESIEGVPSLFIWNVDETRVAGPKKGTVPMVIVSAKTNRNLLTISQPKDNTQLTMVAAISAFGDSTPPLFISKNVSMRRKSWQTYSFSEVMTTQFGILTALLLMKYYLSIGSKIYFQRKSIIYVQKFTIPERLS
jgi:hypothetical protein